MMEWQPIETAPKDGSEFLAYDSNSEKCDVCHCILLGGYPRLVQVQFDAELGPLEDEFGYRTENITHWMPLPEPPK